MGDRHQDRLMIRCGCHCADAIIPSRKASCDGSTEKTLSITSVVDALEECKLGGVECSCWVQAGTQILDSHMGVANNLAPRKKLWGGVVSGISVCERTGNEVGRLDRDIEGSI